MSVAAKESTLPPTIPGATAHTDGAFVPVQSRAERFTSYDVNDFDAVTGQEIDWKLTPVARVSELFEAELDGSVMLHPALAPIAGVSVSWLDRGDALIGRAGAPEERASAAAWSNFDKALHIRVTSEEPVEFVLTRSGLGSGPRAFHTIIESAPGASGTVIIENSGEAKLTENIEIIAGANSDLTVVSVQEWDDSAIHLSNQIARLERDARLRHFVISLGGGVVRATPSIHLAEPGSDIESFGAYFADSGQHLEQRVYIDHDAPNTRSRVNYKGALHGKTARSVWVGDVLIGQKAAGTDSYEQNRNLILDEGPRADSIPNLEIETGDIQGAGHASSTGRFDDEQLFYLRSRGIPEEEARRMVVIGFLAEIVDQIGSEQLQARLGAAIEAEIGRAGAITKEHQ